MCIRDRADTDRYAIKLNYQLYEQIGAPEFEKLEDVIPILKEMQQAYPQNEEGMNVYAMNLFSDFDTTHFFNMMSIYSILGYHWNYLCLLYTSGILPGKCRCVHGSIL